MQSRIRKYATLSAMSSIPKILVTLPTANFTQRRILEGVLAYARDHGPWMFHLNTGDIAGQGLRRIADQNSRPVMIICETVLNFPQ